MHDVALLIGPPGVGNISLARGAAHWTALSFQGERFQHLEVKLHTLTRLAMGKTQHAVAELFSESITEAATRGPTMVLLHELGILAPDRAKLIMEANPVAIHRPTDAVLEQLNMLAGRIRGCSLSRQATSRRRSMAR